MTPAVTGAGTAARKALLVATYDYRDSGLRRLVAPGHDAEALAEVLRDPAIAGFDVTVLVNEPAHVVGEAIADFYRDCRREDLTLLYFSGHGLKDDEGRLYLAMTNTRRDALLFTGLSAAQIDEAMSSSVSRRKVLILDCCYSGAFPAGRVAKADESVHALERFQGKGRAVLTASDSTQYSFEGDDVAGSAAQSVFTRFLVEAIRSGEADLDGDGDIALDELYSYVHDRVVAEMPQQRPKKQEDVDGRIVLARNVHWSLPAHLRNAIDSPLPAQRLVALDGLAHLHRVGNDVVRAAVVQELATLAGDDSRAVSSGAVALSQRLTEGGVSPVLPAPRPAPERAATVPVAPVPTPQAPPAAPVATAQAPPAAPVAVAPPQTVATPLRSGLLALLVASTVLAAALLVVSRFMVFEATNGYHAVDVGFTTANWVVQVALPLVVALGVLLTSRGRPSAVAVAVGVLAGVVLSLLCQLLMSGVFVLAGDVGYTIGPAWWVILLAALMLAAGVVTGVVRMPGLRERPAPRRDARALAGGVVLVVIGAGWLLMGPVSVNYGWWSYTQIPGLVLAGACLWLTVLRPGRDQRRLGLAAVSVFGAWLAEIALEGLVSQPSGARPPQLVTSLLAVLVSVGVAFGSRPSSEAQGSAPSSGLGTSRM